MKIEQISENQIKCTLNRHDLAARQIRMSELAYGTEKTKGLFQDMMDQAFMEFGFEASDLPLMIEAIPVSMDCIVLMITKVEEPEEVDTNFADLTDLNEWISSADDDSDFQSIFELPFMGAAREFFQQQESARPVQEKDASKAKSAPLERIYSFANLSDVIHFAHCAGSSFAGKSSLMKSPFDGRYYMLLIKGNEEASEFGRICSAALEYGSKEPSGFARSAFLREHFSMIIRDKALQNLANV